MRQAFTVLSLILAISLFVHGMPVSNSGDDSNKRPAPWLNRPLNELADQLLPSPGHESQGTQSAQAPSSDTSFPYSRQDIELRDDGYIRSKLLRGTKEQKEALLEMYRQAQATLRDSVDGAPDRK